jgi:ribonuclease-3
MSHADDALLEQRLGHKFVRPELLHTALTHSSALPDIRAKEAEAGLSAGGKISVNNERLEFLGDAVLELLTSEYLLKAFPEWTEGQLSKSRARLVNAFSLEAAARRLRIGEHLRLGRGEEKTGGREKQTLLADAYEAVLAAIYIDAGLDVVREVLQRSLFDQALETVGERMAESDRKSALQELLQSRGQVPAEYRVVGETGPDHQKTFEIEVWVGGERLASAQASTKKEAEQRAATKALALLSAREVGSLLQES